MATITMTAVYSDQRQAWDAEVALERLGVEASRITVEPLGPADTEPHVRSYERLALLGLGRGLGGGVVGAVVGVVLAAAMDASLFLGGLAGAGLGLVIGAVWGIMFQLPAKSEMLAAVDEPGSVTRLSVEVERERRHDVAAVLEDSTPAAGPTVL